MSWIFPFRISLSLSLFLTLSFYLILFISFSLVLSANIFPPPPYYSPRLPSSQCDCESLEQKSKNPSEWWQRRTAFITIMDRRRTVASTPLRGRVRYTDITIHHVVFQNERYCSCVDNNFFSKLYFFFSVHTYVFSKIQITAFLRTRKNHLWHMIYL